jgi:hypothetical protein
MATRRVPPSTPTPGELTRFNPSEWAAPGETSWQLGFSRWKAARRAWIDQHPDSTLGDLIDVLRVNLLTLQELERWRPSPPQGAVMLVPQPYPPADTRS